VRRFTFWASATGAGWILLGYPLSLLLRRGRPWRIDPEWRPRVSILIPAYREREALPVKLRGLADLDYPATFVQVLIAIDGDAELARIAAEAAPEATVSFATERNGKAAGINRALAQADGEIVVMTDANNVLAPGSLKAAIRHFADPGIWAVAGRRGEVGSAYDRYEDLIRVQESRSGSVAAMSGEFVAVRRERMPEFPDGIVNDDFWLLCHLVAAGGRVVYDPAAGSLEAGPSLQGELARRTRMGAGRVAGFGALREVPPSFAFRLASHKFGRLALPFLLGANLLAAVGLSSRPGYGAVAAGELAAGAAAGAATAGIVPPGPVGRVVRMLGQFVVGNYAVAKGVIRGLGEGQSANWEPVD
jgi:poly-beta-1,6-N-acetyl-D-glucosamine synthase